MNINRITPVFVFLSLCFIYIPLFRYYIYLNQNSGHSFMTADWLINNNFGFLNRGLIGTIFINLSDNGQEILNSISFTLISFYILIFLFLSKTLYVERQTLLSYALIFSPATFLFNIYDSQGAFRKEILGILALFLITSSKNSTKKIQIYIAWAILTIGIFSHPVNLFFLTTVLLVLFKHYGIRSKLIYLLFFLSSITFTLMNFSNSEYLLISKKFLLCKELDSINLSNFCNGGSFDYITWDLNAAYIITQNYIVNLNREATYKYMILFLISTIPLFFDKNIFQNFKSYIFIGFSFIPLFLLGYDWGRWINILSICYLSIYLISKKTPYNKFYTLILIFLPFTYTIEHCCDPVTKINFLNFKSNFIYILENFQQSFSIIKF